jgi:hypothetical protein
MPAAGIPRSLRKYAQGLCQEEFQDHAEQKLPKLAGMEVCKSRVEKKGNSRKDLKQQMFEADNLSMGSAF